MIRKTLVLLSLLGFLASLTLWLVSYKKLPTFGWNYGLNLARQTHYNAPLDDTTAFIMEDWIVFDRGQAYFFVQWPSGWAWHPTDGDWFVGGKLAAIWTHGSMSREPQTLLAQSLAWRVDDGSGFEPDGLRNHRPWQWCPRWSHNAPLINSETDVMSVEHWNWGRYIIIPSYHAISVPMFLPSLLLGLAPAWYLSPVYRRRRLRRLGLCIRCRYDLRGSTDRCPECGTAFEMKP